MKLDDLLKTSPKQTSLQIGDMVLVRGERLARVEKIMNGMALLMPFGMFDDDDLFFAPCANCILAH